MSLTILKIVLALVVIQALVKFVVFFLVPYSTRRALLDRQYAGKLSATAKSDVFLLALVVALLGLLFWNGNPEYLSFAVGLYAGMTLIQVYFHRFSKPLAPEEAPPQPVSPIKMMSYAIQANPEKPWSELLLIAVLLVWILFMLVTKGFGWF